MVDMGKQVMQRRTGVWKDVYQLKITNHNDLILFLKLLVPFLRIKKTQAELLIRFCKERKNKVIETGRGSRGKTSFDKLDEEYYLQLRKLNFRGKTNE